MEKKQAYEISAPLKTPMLEICFNLLKQLVDEYFIEKTWRRNKHLKICVASIP